MRVSMSRTDWVLLPVVVVILAGAIYAAFHWLGFLGIGILGLLTGMVAVQVDLEGGRPAGDIRNAALLRAASDRSEARDRAWQADWASAQIAIFIGKIVSAGLIILGFGLFFLVQI